MFQRPLVIWTNSTVADVRVSNVMHTRIHTYSVLHTDVRLLLNVTNVIFPILSTLRAAVILHKINAIRAGCPAHDRCLQQHQPASTSCSCHYSITPTHTQTRTHKHTRACTLTHTHTHRHKPPFKGFPMTQKKNDVTRPRI